MPRDTGASARRQDDIKTARGLWRHCTWEFLVNYASTRGAWAGITPEDHKNTQSTDRRRHNYPAGITRVSRLVTSSRGEHEESRRGKKPNRSLRHPDEEKTNTRNHDEERRQHEDSRWAPGETTNTRNHDEETGRIRTRHIRGMRRRYPRGGSSRE